jgi:hypothetical protein
MKFVPTMDYVFGPTLKWRGLYIISTKIGINTWLYLKFEKALKILCLNAIFDCTSGLVVRNHVKLTIKTSNYVIVNPRPLVDSSPRFTCHYNM